MRRTAKWILGTAAVLIGLLLLLTLSLPLLIDPNSYKDLIARTVREQTGRQVSIPGDIDLEVSPLGLKTTFRLGAVSISSPPAFPDTELLSSRLVEIQLALWPLLHDRELRMDTIRLEGVTLNLIRNQDGGGNWDDTTPVAGEKPAAPAPPAAAKPAGGLAAVDIGGVIIKDLNVRFTDQQAGKSVKLHDLNLSVGRIRPDNPIPVQGDFTLVLDDENGQQPLTVRLNARADLTFSSDRQRISLQGFSGTGQIAGASPGVPELGLTLATDLDLDLGKETAEIKKLVLQKDELQAEAVLSVAGFAVPKVKGTLRIPAFSPRGQAAAWGLTLPLADKESLSKMAAELEFTYEPATLAISRLQLTLDDTSASGSATVRDLQAQPFYDLALRLDRIDLNRYGTGPAAQAEPAAAQPAPEQPGTGSGEQPLLPVALLRGLNFNIDLTVDSLQSGKLVLQNLKLKAGGKDGAITIAPLTTDLYDGSVTVNGEIDARPEIPGIHLTQSTRGIRLGPLFRDLNGKEEITGRADINADLTSSGLTGSELTRNSNGTLNLVVADGEIARLQVIDTIRAARGLLNVVGGKKPAATGTTTSGQSAADTPGEGRPTTFARLTASGVLRNGVFQNDDLQAESELMRVTGKGTVDLVSERLDYLLTIYLAKSIDRNEQTGLVDLADTPIPYRVKGTFAKIEQSAALEEIVKSQAKKVLVKELEKHLGGDKPATGEQQKPGGAEELLQKGLKGLFGK